MLSIFFPWARCESRRRRISAGRRSGADAEDRRANRAATGGGADRGPRLLSAHRRSAAGGRGGFEAATSARARRFLPARPGHRGAAWILETVAEALPGRAAGDVGAGGDRGGALAEHLPARLRRR